MKNQLAYDMKVKKQVDYFREQMKLNPKAIAVMSGAVTKENEEQIGQMNEEQLFDFIKDSEVASQFMAKMFLANDLQEMTRGDKESPADFHERRKQAIVEIHTQCKNEINKRKDILADMGKKLNVPELKEKDNADPKAVEDRELKEMLNGRYPVTLFVNQVFNAVMESERIIGLFEPLLPIDEDLLEQV